LQAEYVSGQYGVILPTHFPKEKEEMKLKVYNEQEYLSLGFFSRQEVGRNIYH
jgi:hypothetical protein